MKFGSLFSGIGGIDLGLERAGMECVWQVESDPYCLRVLEKHWPMVDRWNDVKTFPPDPPASANFMFKPDLICGGFPCQDISNAGKRVGIEGKQSGLWREFSRIVRLFRPRYVFVENVPALLGRGIGRVLGDLAQSGYDSEWDCIPAAALGAYHLRDRLFIVANLDCEYGRKRRQRRSSSDDSRTAEQAYRKEIFINTQGITARGHCGQGETQGRMSKPGIRHGILGGEWPAEPDVVRVVHGVPNRVDRLRGLGNAVVPQVAEWIGRRIMESK